MDFGSFFYCNYFDRSYIPRGRATTLNELVDVDVVYETRNDRRRESKNDAVTSLGISVATGVAAPAAAPPEPDAAAGAERLPARPRWTKIRREQNEKHIEMNWNEIKLRKIQFNAFKSTKTKWNEVQTEYNSVKPLNKRWTQVKPNKTQGS